MNKKAIAYGTVIVAVAAVVAFFWARYERPDEYGEPLSLHYTFVVANQTNRALRGGILWVYAPSAVSVNQSVRRVESTDVFDTAADSIGNQILEFRLGLIPPYGQREISVFTDVALARDAARSPTPKAGEWLDNEPGIESGSPEIAALASSLTASGSAETVAAITAWVAGNIRPSNYDAADRGALHGLSERRGDCTEFAYLVTALARAAKIPARAVDGWVVEGSGLLEAAGLHTWSEVWVDGRWQIVDAHARAEGRQAGHYVAMRVRAVNGGEQFVRFRYRGDGLVVRMK